MDMEFKLEAFEGPLDLLLHLIDKNKVNIYDIPIADITDQYMEYVNAMPRHDLDVVSDFLVMAATLLEIKAKMLLPVEEEEQDEDDPREELVRRLLEYKMYKCMAGELEESMEEASSCFYRAPNVPKEVSAYEPPIVLEEIFDGVTLDKLQQIFTQVMRRREDKLDPIRSRFGNIRREKIRLSDRISYIIDYAKEKPEFSFRELLMEQHDKTEVVVTFLAVLQLMKNGNLTAEQEETFGDIRIVWNRDNQAMLSEEELRKLDEA